MFHALIWFYATLITFVYGDDDELGLLLNPTFYVVEQISLFAIVMTAANMYSLWGILMSLQQKFPRTFKHNHLVVKFW